jgi:AmmeMemoRadiSam system protein B
MYTRDASHAGSWYSNDADELRRQLTLFVERGKAAPADAGVPRAIISPHAGYSYCGPVAGSAHRHLPADCRRVFVLGPSHHVGFRGCALTRAASCATPLGPLPVDTAVVQALQDSKLFAAVSRAEDEDEHSLEMQLPLVALRTGLAARVVPIVVGQLNAGEAEAYARVLAPHLADPQTFFVASSDFCHWGARFRFTWQDKAHGPIHRSIEWLDRAGMTAIEGGDPAQFAAYLERYGNTICGRNPILLLMHTVRAAGLDARVRFVDYAQSSACMRASDSSVSYAAGVLLLRTP